MGTNYYFTRPKCPCCGHAPEKLHIGKSSRGWCFSLHVIPSEGIYSLEDWGRFWWKHPDAKITNEYGEELPISEMLGIIGDRRGGIEFDKPIPDILRDDGFIDQRDLISSWDDFHRLNDSEPGPVGLLRRKIGLNCVGHGPGTWDLIEGDFS